MIAALAQIAPSLGDLGANIDKHLDFIQRAKDGGAELIVFPELSLTGYIVRDMNFELALHPEHPLLDPFRESSSDMTIILGAIEESEHYGVYNSAFVFDRGSVKSYRKIYPPDYGIFEEGRYFLSGESARCIQTRHGRIGVLVCEDLWHLSLPFLQALDGTHMLCVISASPTRMPGAGGLTNYQMNSQQHAALCRLLSVNMVFVNRVGYEDGVNFWGGSEAVNAFGQVLIAGSADSEELLFTEVKEEDVRRARRESRHFLDENIPFVRKELERIVTERNERST